jgi:hypothetical protein
MDNCGAASRALRCKKGGTSAVTLEAAVDVWGRRVIVRFWRRWSLLLDVDLEDNWRERVESTDWRPGR